MISGSSPAGWPGDENLRLGKQERIGAVNGCAGGDAWSRARASTAARRRRVRTSRIAVMTAKQRMPRVSARAASSCRSSSRKADDIGVELRCSQCGPRIPARASRLERRPVRREWRSQQRRAIRCAADEPPSSHGGPDRVRHSRCPNCRIYRDRATAGFAEPTGGLPPPPFPPRIKSLYLQREFGARRQTTDYLPASLSPFSSAA